MHWGCKEHWEAMFTLGEGAVSSYLRKLKLNTCSLTETELVAANMYMPEMLWSLYFMQSQGYDVEIIELYHNNKSSELLMTSSCFLSGKRMKHIKARFFFIKDREDNREMIIVHGPAEEMWADALTKPLQGKAFREMHTKLMNCKVNYEDKEAAMEQRRAAAKASKKIAPVTGRVTKQGPTQT